jgi:IS30 family transposase
MSHVTAEQRYTIAMMLSQGYKQKEIASTIGKDKSVISREISRNKDKRNNEYRYELAHKKCESRHIKKAKCVRFTEEVRKYVELKLALQWSPEQISNREIDIDQYKGIEVVSHERIYQHIIEDKRTGGMLYKELRRKKKYRNRVGCQDNRGKIKNAVNIKHRPKEVDDKTRVGDFEVDLVVGANHKGAMLTINERKTGWTLVRLLESKNSQYVAKKIVEVLKPYKSICKTVTADNGKEFASHEYVSKHLGIDFYFADPYSSWQRGANENYNGLLRQYFPKKTDFRDIAWQTVSKVQKLLNNRPTKRLGYKTPIEIINSLTKVAFAT